MKFSSETLQVLKNFAGINSNLLFRVGNTLRTMSPSRNIWVSAAVTESFDREFAIYDLNKFLATLSLFDDPEIELEDKHLSISQGNRSIKYFYADATLLEKVPNTVKMPSRDIEFNISTKELDEMRKAASVLQVSDISLECNAASTGLVLKVHDRKDDTSNTYSMDVVSNTSSLDFPVQFKTENLKLLGGDYTATACKKGICEFKHNSNDIVYYISMDIKPS
jgi:hypothetical protein